MSRPNFQLDHFEPALFASQGYIVRKGLIPRPMIASLRKVTEQALDPLIGPVEFEAEVGYPGAPETRDASGGDTPRRLLHAYARDSVFADLATSQTIRNTLVEIMETDDVYLSQNHHNCVMTKHPGYSSSTSWHQDIRYWSFDRAELVSIWCALGNETRENGALSVIPGSHIESVERGRLDRDLFLRTDLDENQSLLERQVQVELDAGDVMFFHCRLFHAAGRNESDAVKYSAVFTYHDGDNHPIPGTRSERYPAIPLN
ncbi:MAG: phytanoyl-CoA dioxygenase family protein [Gammaproteobacteria bacterium]|nr:phytanoyl-CoA dioxygenase family protein [Gammaproteobacteria bacterium]